MRFKEFKNINQSVLTELKMTNKLYKMAETLPGVKVGMEFEMIVPMEIEGQPLPVLVPNNIDSIKDVVDFFDNGRNSIRQLSALSDGLRQEFEEWQENEILEQWETDGFDYFKEIYSRRYFDEEAAIAQAEELINDYAPDLDPTSDEYEDELTKIIDGIMENEVREMWDNTDDRAYKTAFRNYRQQNLLDNPDEFSEGAWLHQGDIQDFMRNLNVDYDIEWPQDQMNQERIKEQFIKNTAEEFKKVINRPVEWSLVYKGCERGSDNYCVEPDGSLKPNKPRELGLEFVSPALPVNEILKDLEIIKKWASEKGIYTNKSTGLHMNVSIPNYNVDTLDYVKLVLLMGDEHVLSKFERTLSTFATSAMRKIRQTLKHNPRIASYAFDTLKNNFNLKASKAIHSGRTEKYTSFNTKQDEKGNQWIEFRSPGEDWLGSKYNLLAPTLMQFIVAFDAAIDPNKYKDEYFKKLYKLLDPTPEDADIIRKFVQYSVLPRQPGTEQEFKRTLKIRQRDRGLEKNPSSNTKVSDLDLDRNLLPHGPGPWEIYRRNNGRDVAQLQSRSRPQAHDEAVNFLTDIGLDNFFDHFGVRTMQRVEPDLTDIEQALAHNDSNSYFLNPRGAAPWAIYDNTGRLVARLANTNADQANQEAQRILQSMHVTRFDHYTVQHYDEE